MGDSATQVRPLVELPLQGEMKNLRDIAVRESRVAATAPDNENLAFLHAIHALGGCVADPMEPRRPHVVLSGADVDETRAYPRRFHDAESRRADREVCYVAVPDGDVKPLTRTWSGYRSTSSVTFTTTHLLGYPPSVRFKLCCMFLEEVFGVAMPEGI